MRRLDEMSVLENLDVGECFRLMATQRIGRIAFIVDGEAMLLPVNFCLLDEAVVFRTARGTAFDALVRGTAVVFEVDHADPAYQSGWSVIGRGIAEGLNGALPERELARLPLRPLGHDRAARLDRDPPPRGDGPADRGGRHLRPGMKGNAAAQNPAGQDRQTSAHWCAR